MTRHISALFGRSRTTLALCLAAAIAAPAWAGDNTAADTSATPQQAKSLDAVQVTGTDTVTNIAPSQASMVATEPQSIIGRVYIQENVPPTGDYTDIAAISPSVYTVTPNGTYWFNSFAMATKVSVVFSPKGWTTFANTVWRRWPAKVR